MDACVAVPPIVTFRNVRQGGVYRDDVAFRNAGKKAIRIRLKQPESEAFIVTPLTACNEGETWMLAAGMHASFRLEFVFYGEQDYKDFFTIEDQEGNTLRIGLEALVPQVVLKYDPKLDFGALVDDGRVRVEHFAVSNMGHLEADLELRLGSTNEPITVFPTRARLGSVNGTTGSNKVDVKVEILAKKTGYTEIPVRIFANGVLYGELRVTYSIMGQKVEVLGTNSTVPVEHLDFGCIFYQSSRTIKASVFNNGPAPIDYVIVENSQEVWVEGGGERFPSKPDPTQQDPVLHITPSEGHLDGLAKQTIDFTFKPVITPSSTGWKNNEAIAPRRDYKIKLMIKSISTGHVHYLSLSGSAFSPNYTLTPQLLNFGSCDVLKQKEGSFTLRNNSRQLALPFEIEKIAHFSFEPSVGIVLPEQSISVKCVFKPRHIASFDVSLPVSLAGGFVCAVIKLLGDCSHDPSSMLRSHTQARAHSVPVSPNKKFLIGYSDTTVNKAPFSNPDGTLTRGVHATASKDTQPYVKSTVPKLPDPTVTFTSEELVKHTLHTQKYDNYVKKLGSDRQMKESQKRANVMTKFNNDVDIGIEPYSAPPTPRSGSPPDQAPPSPNNVGSSSTRSFKQTSVRSQSAPDSSASRNLTKKPYRLSSISRGKDVAAMTKKEIETECARVLSPLELHAIQLNVDHVVDFGTVCEDSRNVKTVTFTNTNPFFVAIALSISLPELAETKHKRATLAPQAQCSYELVLSNLTPETSREYSQSISYTVNGKHVIELPVNAMVQPPTLLLSSSSVEIAIGTRVRFARSVGVVTLQNPFSSPIAFEWHSEYRGFSVVPETSVLGPLATLDCEVEVEPDYALPSKALLHLRVAGNRIPMPLTCVVNYGGSKCSFVDRRVQFGTLAINMPSTRHAVVKNSGSTDAFFSVSDISITPTEFAFDVSPKSGTLPAGGFVLLDVCCMATKGGKFDASFTFNTKDGTSILSGAGGQAEQVEVIVDHEPLIFENIPCGSFGRKMLTLTNTSTCDANISFDLSRFGDFHIILPEDLKVGLPERRAECVTVIDDSHNQGVAKEIAELVSLIDHLRLRKDSDTRPNDNLVVYEEKLHSLQKKHDALIPVTSRGFVYSVSLGAQQSSTLFLDFLPTEVALYNFECLISVNEIPSLRKKVTGSSLRPLISLSCMCLDFGSVFLSQGQPSSTVKEFSVTNTSDDVQQVSVNTPAHSPFRVSTEIVAIAPNQTIAIAVTCSITTVASHRATASIFLNKSAQKFCGLDLKAVSSPPFIHFDALELVLPTVPLDVTSSASFKVYAHGYQYPCAITFKLPPPEAHIEISFPNGITVTSAEEGLPVHVSFSSSEPLCVDYLMEVVDSNATKFPFRIAAQTDHALSSLFPYFSANKNAYYIASNGSRSSEDLLDEATRIVERWVSGFGLDYVQPIHIPTSLTDKFGRLAFDMVKHLSGVEVPGIPLVRPSLVKDGQVHDMFSMLLKFLKMHGAFLNDVCPEYLLPREDFKAWREKESAVLVSKGVMEAAPGQLWRTRMDAIEADYESFTTRMWTLVIMQMYRIFVVSTVDVRSLTSRLKDQRFNSFALVASPGRRSIHALSDEPSSSGRAGGLSFQTMDLRNAQDMKEKVNPAYHQIHSQSEKLLLFWLSYYYKLYRDPSVEVTNFGDDLNDGTVWYALLVAHVPLLKEAFFDVFYHHPTTDEQKYHNALRVTKSLNFLGLDFGMTAADIVTPSLMFNLMFACYLYGILPSYLPQVEPLVFAGALQESIMKTLEVENPTKAPWVFRVLVVGPDVFSAPETFQVPAKGTGRLNIQYLAKFSSPCSAFVFLIGKQAARGTVLTYQLHASVNQSVSRSIPIYETLCYSKLDISVEISNPFPYPAEFTVSVSEASSKIASKLARTKSSDAKASSKGKNENKKAVNNPSKGGERSLSANPRFQQFYSSDHPAAQDNQRIAFFTPKKTLNLKAKQKAVVPLMFVPTRLGYFLATVTLKNAEVGEMSASVGAFSGLPAPLKSLRKEFDLQGSIAWGLEIPYANEAKLDALKLIPSIPTDPVSTKNYDITIEKSCLLSEDIDLSVDLTGNPAFSCPRTVNLTPGVPSAKGTVFAPHISTATLIDPHSKSELPILFKPLSAGTYYCVVILTANDDVRIYQLEAIVKGVATK